MSTLILRTTVRILTPVVFGISLYLLVRGHNSPGGGFIAALVAGTGLVLRFLAFGDEGMRRFVPVRFAALAGTGLALSVAAALGGYAVGGGFFAGNLWSFDPPLIGEIKLAWSLGFDLGVYLVVIAAIVALVRYLGEGAEEGSR